MLRSSNFIEYRLPIGGRYSPFPWDAVATGASGLFGLFGASENRKSVEATNRMNLRIARETNQAQADLAAKNNEAQLQMMRENNQWSADQALKMFNLENQYNSPGAQAGRLLDYGLNPAVALGNGAIASSNGNISTPSAAGATFSPTMPNFVTPSLQAPPSVLLGAVDAIAGLAGAANQFAQAGKTNKEAKRVNEQIDAEIKSLLSSAKNQDAQSAYTKTKNLIEGEWLPKRYEAEVSRMFSECYLSYLKGETEKADALFKKFEAKLSELKGKRYEEETPIVIQQARETVTLIQEQQKEARARISEAQAGAEQKREVAISEREFRDLRRKSLQIANGIDAQEFLRESKTFNEHVDYLLKQYRNSGLLSDKELERLEQEVEIAKKENNWYHWDKVLNTIERINDGANKWAPWAISRTDSETYTTETYKDRSGSTSVTTRNRRSRGR